jgi:ribosome-binding protein aMBF1 (putative translation factor)
MRKQVCKQCSRELALAKGFYRHASYATGHMKTCKKCHRANVKANEELKFERIRERKRLWASRPENVAKRRAYRETPRGREVHRATCNRYNRFKRMEAQAS